MIKIVILDYSTCEVHVFDFDLNQYKDGEDFLEHHFSEHGQTFKVDQCEWMVVDLEQTEGRLPIYVH